MGPLFIQARGASKGIRAACPSIPNTTSAQAFSVLNVVTRRGALQYRSQPLGRAMLLAPPADRVRVERLRPLRGQHVIPFWVPAISAADKPAFGPGFRGTKIFSWVFVGLR